MARKRKTNYPFAGRPPKDPLEKVGRPVRALVTVPVMEAIQEDMDQTGINLSEVFRLALYRYLDHKGMITPELRVDPTWISLVEKGLI